MKLISMTDFVLGYSQNSKTGYEAGYNALVGLRIFKNYAQFLKQPLTLGMFVPCDEDGNVLDSPRNANKDSLAYDWLHEQYRYKEAIYQQAKERVLFERFSVKRFIDKDNPCYVVSNGENEVTFHIGLYTFSKGVDFAKTIEDLTHIQPTLTQTAIKQIYG